MNQYWRRSLSFGLCILIIPFGFAAPHKKPDSHGDHSHETKEPGHEEHEEHEEEVTGSNIGPDKGLLSYSETSGFVLSPEASKTFGLQLQALSGNGPWVLPASTIVYSTSNTTLFRLREGAYKAIPISILLRKGSLVTLRSPQLRAGDSVVIQGASFLRIAEIDATSGEVGHSH